MLNLLYESPRHAAPNRRFVSRLAHGLVGLCVLVTSGSLARAEDEYDAKHVPRKRLEIMTSRIESLVVSSTDPEFPKRMQSTPLFRYDDETRGYVDGTVWRLGEKGRPLAIVTAELHPRYLGGGPRVVYDFLSLRTAHSWLARRMWQAGRRVDRLSRCGPLRTPHRLLPQQPAA